MLEMLDRTFAILELVVLDRAPVISMVLERLVGFRAGFLCFGKDVVDVGDGGLDVCDFVSYG